MLRNLFYTLCKDLQDKIVKIYAFSLFWSWFSHWWRGQFVGLLVALVYLVIFWSC